MKTPLVTVAIPTFNSSDYIEKALESILLQSYANIEIYLIDNCSNDTTVAIANHLKQKYASKNFKIIQNLENIGGEANFNKCLEMGTGKYVTVYHSDDIYDIDIVKKSVECLEMFHTDAVATASCLIDENDNVIINQKLPSCLRQDTKYNFDTLFPLILQNGNFIVCPSVMIRRNILQKTCKFDYKKFKTSSDLGLWLNIAQNGTFSFINQQLIQYRIHKKQGSYLTKKLFHRPDIMRVLKFYKQFTQTKDIHILYLKFLLKYSTKIGFNLFEHKKRFFAKKIAIYNIHQIQSILLFTIDFKSIRYFLKNLYLFFKTFS